MPDSVAGDKPRGGIMSDRDNAVIESDLIEESLVEEVSIDGMCGVY
jgi:mycofactocin precursor peptide MftA